MTAILFGLFWAVVPRAVYSHSGGTPQLTNEPAGPYRVYAWTQPEPLRAGEAHVSIAVTQLNEDAPAGSSEVETPVTDVNVTVALVELDENGNPTSEPATVQAVHDSLLNDIYYEADTAIPEQGDWRVTIDVDGTAQTAFDVEVLSSRETNWTLVAGGGVILIALLALGGILSRKQAQNRPQRRSTRPSTRRRTA